MIRVTAPPPAASASSATSPPSPFSERKSKGSPAAPRRRSLTVARRPGTRWHMSRTRSQVAAKSKEASVSKSSQSGQKRTCVKVRRVGFSRCRSWVGVNPSPSRRPASRSLKSIRQTWPSRPTSTRIRSDRALTTEAPTPCSPPLAP